MENDNTVSTDWRTAVQSSNLSTTDTLRGYQEGRNRQDGNFVQQLGSFVSDARTIGGYKESGLNLNIGPLSLDFRTGYNLVGIKATEVENMRNAIRDYVARVQAKVNETLESNDAKLREAVRGAKVIEEVNAYIDKVKLYCQNVTSGLLVFSDKLADVGNAWITATENMASTVSSTTGAFSEGSRYTDNVQYRGQ